MERTTAAVGVAALIGIVALAMAAATVTEPAPTAGGGGGAGSGGGFGLGETDPAFAVVEVPFLREVLLVIGLVLAIVAVVYFAVHWREAFRIVVGLVALVVLLMGLAELVGRTLGPATAPIGNRSGGLPPGGPGGPAGPTAVAPSLPVLVGLLVLAGVLVALGLRRIAKAGADGTAEGSPGRAAAVGRAAGRAADRIETSGDIGNEVYRAWVEMTELLEVAAPESTTPGQFAAAAVDAGLDRGDVDELTRLFEDVRYGGRPVTPIEERRAIAVLRRIESAYGEADG